MPSKSLQATETSTTWTDTGGDKLLDMGGQVAGTARVGAFLDLGASPRANWYEVVFKIDGFATAPAVREMVELFFAQSNATTGFDGQLTTDPTVSAEGTLTDLDMTLNLTPATMIRAVSTTAADVIQGRAIIKLTGRYVAPVVVNRSLFDSLNGTSESHTIVLTPIPQEGQ
jgi:hypothetical protein